ncbi:bifunctional oligoribonuclease/PAP phosphatase NrnA [Aquibacillus sp. 3ASR75-11]|uniref:Bifunctional oligoribonuclease/PAP phosphatase NrnA n=1 Tax=Terrihalobacillus insolitus TaxID=2950438 RepID=A0A9X3WSS2_9BACI|nr:bifunctional oligoribonuclease/PAP phosphatase NrnA [Terrihalobacillus insolitus]MDC3412643.1 bifunctional oligoribonuclease/PAP phosphatase NrnA [Terrihalobacillus insolitus]MDC3423993.1 bifunctional oligoribonuclease/PAP phosphatase NrnA [Terrihalobacillus insolitus]
MTKTNIIAKIKANETVIIHRHVRPDPDAYGSQVGLAKIIKSSFPEKKVFVVGEEDPAFSFLAVMDDIQDAEYENALVIICDTANQARISDQRYNKGKEVIKIDHHPNVDPYGDIAWVDTEASSTSEMIFELYLFGKDKGLTCPDEAARLIYGGIVGDTGRFLFPSTTNKTFQYASDLVTFDFDRSALYEGLYNTKPHVAKLKGYVLQNFEITANGVSAVKLTKEILQEHQMTPMETGQLVGILGDIDGVYTWVFFVEEEDLIRVRIRSKGPVINEIAAKYNGGGHPMAAGASVYSWEETEQVKEDLEMVCAAFKKKVK